MLPTPLHSTANIPLTTPQTSSSLQTIVTPLTVQIFHEHAHHCRSPIPTLHVRSLKPYTTPCTASAPIPPHPKPNYTTPRLSSHLFTRPHARVTYAVGTLVTTAHTISSLCLTTTSTLTQTPASSHVSRSFSTWFFPLSERDLLRPRPHLSYPPIYLRHPHSRMMYFA